MDSLSIKSKGLLTQITLLVLSVILMPFSCVADSLWDGMIWDADAWAASDTTNDVSSVPVYRFYSTGAPESTYTHLWTINTTERDVLMAYPSWQYEGIGWYALTNTVSGTVPLYRLYEPNIRRHLYTINATEYVALDGGSWNGEDVQYFVYPTNSVSGTIPAYRFYHSVNQNHHFTISENEKDTINANPDWGYNYEGIAFYVFQTNAPSSFRSPVAQAEQKAKQTAVVSEYAHAGHGIQDSMSYEEQTAVKHNIRYNPQTGRWYLISETEQRELIPVPGDYSGNGIEDLALYEQATGNWYVRFTEEARSSKGYYFHPSAFLSNGADQDSHLSVATSIARRNKRYCCVSRRHRHMVYHHG